MLLAGCVGFTPVAQAQPSLDELGFGDAEQRLIRALLTAPVGSPGASFGSPIAFGARWGDIFAGIGGSGLSNRSPGSNSVDGSAIVGMGLGNPDASIGAEMTVGIISLRESFGEDGQLNFKLHTNMSGRVAFAAGVENVAAWGSADQIDPSSYAVASKAWTLRPNEPESPLTLIASVGIGNNRFDDVGEDGTKVFGSAALFFTRRFTGIVDWAGNSLNLAVSILPVESRPITLTLGIENVTERNGSDAVFSGGIGYSFNFLK